jgi:uroporphyrinogen decarboxylase
MKVEKPFLQILNGQKPSRIPFWLMRQAGRYLPEYRDLRSQKKGFMDMAMDPDAAAEITVQPIRRFGMDAAIIFSDILVIPHALGQKLDFVNGEGPKLGEFNFESLNFIFFDEKLAPVYAAIEKTKAMLIAENHAQTALIGFAGAPWTVATYMIEGGGSKDFAKVKSYAYGQPDDFKKLIDLLVDATSRYLISQIKAGAETVQIFDTWAGALDGHGIQHQVIEPTKKIVAAVRAAYPEIPIIGFPKGIGVHTQAYIEQTGVSAIGLDATTCTFWAKNTLQPLCPVQGNLDPMRLLAGGPGLQKAAHKILRDFSSGRHIFNLGHGVHKDTPVEHVYNLTKILRDYNL